LIAAAQHYAASRGNERRAADAASQQIVRTQSVQPVFVERWRTEADLNRLAEIRNIPGRPRGQFRKGRQQSMDGAAAGDGRWHGVAVRFMPDRNPRIPLVVAAEIRTAPGQSSAPGSAH
jgi:hypothetical protein